jgi:hypothetical protein
MVEFHSERMAYTLIRSGWCDTIVLKFYVKTKDIIGDVKDDFYAEIERVFD